MMSFVGDAFDNRAPALDHVRAERVPQRRADPRVFGRIREHEDLAGDFDEASVLSVGRIVDSRAEVEGVAGKGCRIGSDEPHVAVARDRVPRYQLQPMDPVPLLTKFLVEGKRILRDATEQLAEDVIHSPVGGRGG
jgi:hypothetical protein